MKVICLVPSLTETLIEAGVDVVGRTRFCIHPEEKVKVIPVVGGTKNLDWAKVKELNADILIFDKEENPKAFADESHLPYLAVHVEDIASCAAALKELGEKLKAPKLNEYAERFLKLKSKPIALGEIVSWVQKPPNEVIDIMYLIWKDPLMAVGRNTFIGSVLQLLGYKLAEYAEKYPKIENELNNSTVHLFSSEPYPFANHTDWIRSLHVPSAIVDGESFSWFGIRSLRFLEGLGLSK